MQGGGGGLIRWIGGPQISGRDVEATFRVMLPRSYSGQGIVVSIEDGYGADENFSDSSTASPLRRYHALERNKRRAAIPSICGPPTGHLGLHLYVRMALERGTRGLSSCCRM